MPETTGKLQKHDILDFFIVICEESQKAEAPESARNRRKAPET